MAGSKGMTAGSGAMVGTAAVLVVVAVVVVTTVVADAEGRVRQRLCVPSPPSPGVQGRDGAPGSKLKVLSRVRGQSKPHLHTPSVCR